MPADRAPGGKRPGEGLVDQILGGVPVTDADQDGAEAIITGFAVELSPVVGIPHLLNARPPRGDYLAANQGPPPGV